MRVSLRHPASFRLHVAAIDHKYETTSFLLYEADLSKISSSRTMKLEIDLVMTII